MSLPVVPQLAPGDRSFPASAECSGVVQLGALPAEVSAQLAKHAGPWLEFAPDQGAIVVRHVQPEGCPVIAGVPCELLTILDTIPTENRRQVPGGALLMRTQRGRLVRLLVEEGQVQIQWAAEDYEHATPTTLDEVLPGINPAEACVNGWVRLPGAEAAHADIEALVDRFEGLYPSGAVELEPGEPGTIRFDAVNVGPGELLAVLRGLGESAEKLDGQLTVSSFAPTGTGTGFRLRIRDGRFDALRPALFPGE